MFNNTKIIIAIILMASVELVQAVTVTRYPGPDASGVLCKPSGIMVGYFNGVNTTRSDARRALRVLKAQYGITAPSGEKMFYELFYNNTDELLIDAIETMNLRLSEIDPRLKDRYDLIYKSLIYGNMAWVAQMGDINPALRRDLKSMFGSLLPSMVAGISSRLGNPASTSKDLADNQVLLEKYKTEGKKFILVAHSEGNLFANRAYNYVTTGIKASVAKIIHIAPASVELHGDYVLGDYDLVINGLRAIGPGSVKDNNWRLIPVFSKEASLSFYLDLAASTAVDAGNYVSAFIFKVIKDIRGVEYCEPDDNMFATDWMGHKFFEIYNNPNKTGKTETGRSRLNSLWVNTLALVDSTARSTSIADGFFNVTMTWDIAGDIDLHIFEPSNAHVYYSNQQGRSGRLDRDDTTTKGPEHYYATCTGSNLTKGNYNFGVVNYGGRTGTKVTFDVYDYQQRLLKSYTTVVGASSGSNAMPVTLFTLSLTQDPITSEYIVTLP